MAWEHIPEKCRHCEWSNHRETGVPSCGRVRCVKGCEQYAKQAVEAVQAPRLHAAGKHGVLCETRTAQTDGEAEGE